MSYLFKITNKFNYTCNKIGLKPTKKTVVNGIVMLRKLLDFTKSGDNASVL